MTFEHLPGALGIGTPTPRISWKTSAEPGWTQDAYQLTVTTSEGTWTSERLDSAESVLVPWPCAPLASAQRADVSVRVWGGGQEEPSEWSPASAVETGLLNAGDWTATPISPSWGEDADGDRRPPLLRRSFTLRRPVASARLYVTAHGLYEMEINGSRVGDDALAPGWTVYGKRLRYYTYDVTDHLAEGENAHRRLARRRLVPRPHRLQRRACEPVRGQLALLAQLHVTHDDGSVTVVGSDSDWKASYGPILFSSLYKGELYDARRAGRTGGAGRGSTTPAGSPSSASNGIPQLLCRPRGRPCAAPRSCAR